jgi:hypothetical protein
MMGEHLRFCLRSGGKAFAQHRGDPAVELLASALQERLVGGIPHERMLEGVDSIRRCAATKRQFGLDKFAQSGPERRLVHLRGPGEQLVTELAADDSADLRYFLDRRRPIEASQERVLQRRRRLPVAVRHVGPVAFAARRAANAAFRPADRSLSISSFPPECDFRAGCRRPSKIG